MSRGQKLGVAIFVGIAFLVLIIVFAVTVVNNAFSNLGDSISKILPSGYEDEDIEKYVKDEHGIDISIVNNKGPYHPKTGDGGFATVVSQDDDVEFDVFISTFGNIKGDNYLFIKHLPEMKQAISTDIQKLEKDQLALVSLDVDDEKSNFSLKLAIPTSINYVDQAFLQLIDRALTVVNERNNYLEKEYDVEIDRVYFDFFPENDHGEEVVRISYGLRNSYHSLEDLQDELIRQNEKTILSLFAASDLEELELIAEDLPWLYTFETSPLKCLKFNGFASCDSYAVSLEFSDDQTYDDFVEHRYDNPETIEMIFDTIQLLQSVNIPIDQFNGPKLFLPDDLSMQTKTEKELLKQDSDIDFNYHSIVITNIQEIKTTEDVIFEK